MMNNGSALATLSNQLADAVATGSRSIVAIHARRRIPTSGIIWRPGIVVGTNHTIRRDEEIELSLPTGKRVPATLAGRDPGTDLAVLRVPDATDAATLGATDDLAVGNLVLAVGRPGESTTASFGVVSAVGGEWRSWHGGHIDRFVRLDLAIYDGFSGGALLDVQGRTLGINTSGLARATAVTVPVTTVEGVITQILEHGAVRYGYLGLGMQPVRLPADTIAGRDQTIGLVVVSLEPGGPAINAGILLGDILIAIEHQSTTDVRRALAMVRAARVGDVLHVELLRGGTPKEVSVTVGSRD